MSVVDVGLVIFDCDGVVVDSEPITIGVLHEMLVELGVGLTPAEVGDHFTGHTFARVLERGAALLGRPLPPGFRADYGKRTFAALSAQLKPVEGVVEVLDRLAVPYCIASNGPQAKMQHTLDTVALLQRFEGRRFSADDVAHGKPAPDLFLHAGALMGVPPAACLVVEDSATGVRAARAAGMRIVGYAPAGTAQALMHAGAERTIHRMTELIALIEAGPSRW